MAKKKIKAWAIINELTGEPFMPYFDIRKQARYWKKNKKFKFFIDYEKTKIFKIEIKIL